MNSIVIFLALAPETIRGAKSLALVAFGLVFLFLLLDELIEATRQ